MKSFLDKYPVVLQFAKFAVVGIINTFVDWFILYILIKISGYESGWHYTLFKSISFIIAVTNSYFLNKFWAFSSKSKEKMGMEFTSFILVSLVGMGVNVGVASLVVNFINPLFGLSSFTWAYVGAFSGTLTAFIWNFIGYKIIVFKDKK